MVDQVAAADRDGDGPVTEVGNFWATLMLSMGSGGGNYKLQVLFDWRRLPLIGTVFFFGQTRISSPSSHSKITDIWINIHL